MKLVINAEYMHVLFQNWPTPVSIIKDAMVTGHRPMVRLTLTLVCSMKENKVGGMFHAFKPSKGLFSNCDTVFGGSFTFDFPPGYLMALLTNTHIDPWLLFITIRFVPNKNLKPCVSLVLYWF